MNYRAGELDQRIKIQVRQSTPDGMGGSSFEWVDFANAWAHVRPKSGGESVNYDKLSAEQKYIFVIRNMLINFIYIFC